ncbi:MAG: excinuclease ABC subunit UvrA [Pirellulales bacterium]
MPAAPSVKIAPPAAELICVRGARVHNLQNVSLDLPRDKLVVITGPSGSGKSSLAYDTLFAEGQRQYIETLSTYARQFVDQLERPDVDLVEGLPPTISIDQRAGSLNPRSTVATVTEIYDYLRLLMARLGTPACPECGLPIRPQSAEQIVERLQALPEGTKAMILAPLVRGRKGAHKEELAAIRKAGFVRARLDGQIYDLDQLPEVAPRKNHDLDAIVDRVVIRDSTRGRTAESVHLALKHGGGTATVLYAPPGSAPDTWKEEFFSTLSACPRCNASFAELEPRSFSFNSAYGACPRCEGLGRLVQFDPDLVLPDPERPVADCVATWKGAPAAVLRKQQAAVGEFLTAAKATLDTPLGKLAPTVRERLWSGDGAGFGGLAQLLEQELATTIKEKRLEQLERYREEAPCPECGGARLRAEARACKFAGLAIHEITALSVLRARAFFQNAALADAERQVGERLVREIDQRLSFLAQVGLDYLTLDRPADTLSGGELQRVRLATGIGSGLVGVCYILDEPSIGLHPRDNQRLIDALRRLQAQGNTVIVVEHDEAIMRQADWLVDVGPAAGAAGGCIVAEGPPAQVMAAAESITGDYLAGRREISVPQQRRPVNRARQIMLEGATEHNLQSVDASFPLGLFVCVTGVSGSGKSSLVNDTLARALERKLGLVGPKPGPYASLKGAQQIDKLITVDQSPLGRTPRSNTATYTGLFDEIRRVFVSTREARQRGYGPSRFSFNVKGGRCETCQGQGVQRIEMKFLPDLYVPCPECGGRRFNRQTLEVRYKGLSIAGVLELSVTAAAEFFASVTAIRRPLESLVEVGLGYLTLGQPSTTLSGGEAQRVKLATELARVHTGNTLYLLDEPTTGLHFDDVKRLLAVLNRLVDAGNTVLVIEHNLDVMKSADWIIDLGPEGGEGGGRLVGEGTPEEVAARYDTPTARYLKTVLRPTS